MLGLSNTLANSGKMSTPFYFSNKYSLEFDATDDLIALDSSVTAGTDSTLSIWIKRGDLAEDAYLWGEDDNAYNYVMWIAGGSSADVVIQFGTPYAVFSHADVRTALYTTNWLHIVLTRAGDDCILYVNGVLKDTLTQGDFSVATAVDTIANKPDGTKPFGGIIDEAGIWESTLDADNVTAIYNGGYPTALDEDSGDYNRSGQLVGWWRMGDGTEKGAGSTVYDMSRNSVNGTITGAAYSLGVPTR